MTARAFEERVSAHPVIGTNQATLEPDTSNNVDSVDDRVFVSVAKRRGAKQSETGTGRLEDERVEARAVVEGFRAAQHELDEANDVVAMPAQAVIARKYLVHVAEAAQRYGSTSGKDAVRQAADSFDQALQRFLSRSKPSRYEFEQLVETSLRVRRQLAIPVTSPRASYRKETGTDASYIKSTLPAVLQLIEVRCKDGINWLQRYGDDDRNQVVANLATDLQDSIGHVKWLTSQLSFEDRKAFEKDLGRSADEMMLLLEWIRTRTAHHAMETQFLKSVRAFDHVLLDCGVPMVEKRPAPLSGEAIESGRQEHETLKNAKDALDGVLDQVQVRQQSAIGRFNSLAALTDVEKPNFIEELFKAALVAALGHFGGHVIGLLKGDTALPRAAQTISLPPVHNWAAIIDKVADVGTDTVQSLVGQAIASTAKTNPMERARAAFVAGMEIDAKDRQVVYRRNVEKLIKASQITAGQIDKLRERFASTLGDVHASFYEQTAHAWASYNAQSRIGAVHRGGTKGKRVSAMKDYFGKPRSEHDSTDRAGGTSKQGTVGVFSMTLWHDNGVPKPKLQSSRVNGMNSSMRAAILEGAGHDFDKIWLPKEVHVRTARGGHAVIALDERNEIRDVINWTGYVSQDVGLDTAARYWALWKNTIKLQ
jgi:hypothetical protein